MVKANDYVLIHYTGKFDNGDVFDTSEGRQPLEFQVGSGMVIPGLDREMIGMKIDDEKSITIAPNDAYGEYNDQLTQAFPKEDAGTMQVTPGMQLNVQLMDGSYRPASVKDVTDTEIILDLNHPLAGKTLHFEIKLVEINDFPKYSSGCSSCGGSCSDDGCGC